MAFDYNKFLAENQLTTTSRLRAKALKEADMSPMKPTPTGGPAKTPAPTAAPVPGKPAAEDSPEQKKAIEDTKSGKLDPTKLMSYVPKSVTEANDDDDMEEPEDSWNKPDEFDSADDEKEPSKKDVKASDAMASAAGGKQGKLRALVQQKDMILSKFKAGEISIDQYKAEIGDIPQQIKNLQADLDADLSVDDEEEA